MGDSEEEVQATHVDATSNAHSSPKKVGRKDAAENAVASQRSRIESTSPPGSKNPKASSESPRKPCRSTTLTGPKAPIPRRRSSVPVRRKGQDLISFHRQSCRLFQSLEGTLASNHDWTNDTKQLHAGHGSMSNARPSSLCIIKTDNGFAYLTSTTSIPLLGSSRNSRRHSSVATPSQPFYGDIRSPPAPTISSSFSSLAGISSSILAEKNSSPLACPPTRPQPVSIISWTSAESRRYEYQKIDRSHSGIRGFWKRLTPRWCHGRHVRSGFFNARSGVGGTESVRRYRMTFEEDEGDDDNDDGDDDKNDGHMDMEKKTNTNKNTRTNWSWKWKWKWNCFNLLR
jgi:hypothetical protein